MSKQIKIDTSAAPKAIGPYSQAVAFDNLVFCSGQIPLIPEKMELEIADVKVQSERVLNNLKAVLLAANSSPKNVLKTTVFLTDLKNFEVFNKVYEEFFKANGCEIPPARSTIQISALPKASLVEVEAIAYKS
jgi:2-iminobutanoate/2-iminopropanoate deaminase